MVLHNPVGRLTATAATLPRIMTIIKSQVPPASHLWTHSRLSTIHRSYYLRSSSKDPDPLAKLAAEKAQRELILSVLEAHPSARDSRLYLKSFAPPLDSPSGSRRQPSSANHDHSKPGTYQTKQSSNIAPFPTTEAMPTTATLATSQAFSSKEKNKQENQSIEPELKTTSIAESILSAPHQHTGLVKIQGPFTDRQLESIVDGMIYLKKLGLMAIIVLDDEEWHLSKLDAHRHRSKFRNTFLFEHRESLRQVVLRETSRLCEIIEERGGEARPMTEGVLRLGDGRAQDSQGLDLWLDHIQGLRSAIQHQHIPIIPPIAVNSSCAAVCIPADEVVKALARGLAHAGKGSPLCFQSQTLSDVLKPADTRFEQLAKQESDTINIQSHNNQVDLTPLRLMIINREGGIPSPARNGHPHLSINLESEFQFINETFRWQSSHPTSLANLAMAKDCLKYLPNESSAIIVSHRSPKSLIANLITNKPAHSPSLKHSILVNHHRGIGQASPTLIRKGLPIRVIKDMRQIDKCKLTNLLEASFGKKLKSEAFFERLEKSLRFVILAGDYQGVAIVTDEKEEEQHTRTISYLDKFAVLPSLQGEGIVDFLWGALRDESFGLGCLDALNNNGGLGGIGEPIDLVWRSRTNNPVNRWYWARSNGFIKIGKPNQSLDSTEFSLFWCLGDHDRLEKDLKGSQNEMKFKESNWIIQPDVIQRWCKIIKRIPTCWTS